MSGPIVEPEPDMAAGRGRSRRSGAGRWLRRALTVAVLLALAPLLLTLLYLPPFVHPVSTLMLKDLATLDGYDRRWVSIDEVAPVVAQSILMSEDGQFCTHRGIDWRELSAVLDNALQGEATRGASTITMQTAKNLFLWHRPLAGPRKLIEMPLAVYMDLVMPKRRIMEIYLNIVELGPHIYGVEAAARHHFGKSARQLSRREAALLAVTLPNPVMRDPARPSRGMGRLANRVERLARVSRDYVGCLGLGSS